MTSTQIEYNVVLVGGGLAGLCSAIALSKAGVKVLVIEKEHYPFHRVCGEYISMEVLPYLNSLGIDPFELQASTINRLMVSSPSGKILVHTLDLGGFGLSRYTLDAHLFGKAKELGVDFICGKKVVDINFVNPTFLVTLNSGTEIAAPIVIGSFGKRSNLDKELDRSFMTRRSPYVAVKYHIRTDHPKDLIALHNFQGGYCGISAIEGDRYCLCYMTERKALQQAGSIQELEERRLTKNPYLKHIFSNAEFLYDKPLVINEISFESKSPVENHILMAGDAAGMITPLCGNGMAMAIHSSKILSDLVLQYFQSTDFSRNELEVSYAKQWKQLFANRMRIGRNVQKLFGNERITNWAIWALGNMKPLTSLLVKSTHGRPF
jgi:flavin-dependent dehydrogenase